MAHVALFPIDVRGDKQNDDGDGYCGNGEIELRVRCSRHDDNKLDSKAEEEEEIELEQSDVNLMSMVSAEEREAKNTAV